MNRMKHQQAVAKCQRGKETPESLRNSARLFRLIGRDEIAEELNRRAVMLTKARASEGR